MLAPKQAKRQENNKRQDMKRNIAVILAGGVGSRLGMSTPKQFFKVAGKMVVEHTVDVFERNSRIDEIAIVSNPMLIADFENIVLRNKWRKVKKILKGGKERYDSSLSAIQAYADEDVNLIFHDAVRPLLSQRTLNDVIDALHDHKAIDVAVPSADTIIEVEGDYIANIPDRSRLRRGQTPQAFDRQLIQQAYGQALQDPAFKTTDDCGVVRRYTSEPVFVVSGEESNMKLTYREDTYMMDKLFQLKNTEPDNNELSAETFGDKVAVVFGGSYGIGKNIVDMLEGYGAKVFSFSRSAQHIDVGQREDVAKALKEAADKAGHRLCGVYSRTAEQGAAGHDGLSDHYQRRADQLYGHGERGAGGLSLPQADTGQARVLHLKFLHTRTRLLQHLLVDKGSHRQLCTGRGTRVGRRRHKDKLHKPRAHKDTHATEKLRH